MAKNYRLVFSGETETGIDISLVKSNLRKLLKKDAAEIDQIFTAEHVTLKSHLDYETAVKFKAIFEETGARCSIESMPLESRQPPAPVQARAAATETVKRRMDIPLPPEFQAVQDQDEEIYWLGKPNFTAFMTRGIPLLLIGLIWGSIDYFGFIRNMNNIPLGFALPFFALHLLPLWAGLLNFIRLFLVHGNTCYAFSNKRMMLRSGFWGTDFNAVDYDQISAIDVNVNPIENMLGVGTIRAYSGRSTAKGSPIYDQFIGIENPYDVYKRIKEVSVDIKTDWNYPNAMRPANNPGYQTGYDKKP